MVRGSRLLICDNIMEEPGVVSRSVEQMVRIVDQNMSVLFGSKERTRGEWTALVQAVGRTQLKLECSGPMMLLYQCVDDDWSGLGERSS